MASLTPHEAQNPLEHLHGPLPLLPDLGKHVALPHPAVRVPGVAQEMVGFGADSSPLRQVAGFDALAESARLVVEVVDRFEELLLPLAAARRQPLGQLVRARGAGIELAGARTEPLSRVT